MGALRQAFPDGRFNEPATESDIAVAEAELGVALPSELRDLYLETNGFREAKGNSQYLLPLTDLVRDTEFLWKDIAADAPQAKFPSFSSYVFFGMSSADHWWGVLSRPPHNLVAWHHNMLDDDELDDGFEHSNLSIVGLFKEDNTMYDDSE